jgi:pimeloyl-ACP methyl ester carboxylesterase
MSKFILGVLLIFAQSALSAEPQRPPQQPEVFSKSNVEALEADSLLLRGSLEAYGTATATPLVICLPMMGHTMDSYRPLWYAWLDARTNSPAGINNKGPKEDWLALDLRGHGASRRKNLDSLDFRTMPVNEFDKYPSDVRLIVTKLARSPKYKVDTSSLTIIGASIGANTAALLTEQMPYIKRLILLSPGLNYKGLEPADAIMTFKGKILLVASQGDAYSYNSVREMAALNPDHCTLMIFEGDAHGTDIINDSPDAIQALVDWLLKN